MLLGSKVNALSVYRQCFTSQKAMLFNNETKGNALRLKRQCFQTQEEMFYTPNKKPRAVGPGFYVMNLVSRS